jgi:large exoprotein involved in heme utilization and adhesion
VPSQITASTNSPILSASDIVGSVNIKTDQLTVKDGALISVSGQQLGKAGNLNINADILRLDNGSSLRADTNVDNQGNINIKSESILLRRVSQISTNATGSATGGNISINTGTLTALDNSDITANSQNNFGGQVTINAQGIFGTRFREQITSKSDITATSESGVSFNGQVDIVTPDIQHQNNLKEQSANFTNVDKVVASSCLANRNVNTGKFVVTGRGGLYETPERASSIEYYMLPTLPVANNNQKATDFNSQKPIWKIGDLINEASQLVVSANGRLLLVAHNQNISSAQNLTCDM